MVSTTARLVRTDTQRNSSWPGARDSTKGRIHCRRLVSRPNLPLQSRGGPYIVVSDPDDSRITGYSGTDFLSSGGEYGAAAFAEGDAGEAFFFADATEDYFVAVFEEGAGFAVGEWDGLGAALGDFE
jgi:hypothetical protein